MVAVRAATTAAYERGNDDGAGAGHTEEPSGSTRDSVVAQGAPTLIVSCCDSFLVFAVADMMLFLLLQ